MLDIYNRDATASNTLLQIEIHKKIRLRGLQKCMFRQFSSSINTLFACSPSEGMTWQLFSFSDGYTLNYLLTHIVSKMPGYL